MKNLLQLTMDQYRRVKAIEKEILEDFHNFTKEQVFEARVRYSASKQTLSCLQSACLDSTDLETIKKIVENREIVYEVDGLWAVELVEATMLFGDDYVQQLRSRTQGNLVP